MLSSCLCSECLPLLGFFDFYVFWENIWPGAAEQKILWRISIGGYPKK